MWKIFWATTVWTSVYSGEGAPPPPGSDMPGLTWTLIVKYDDDDNVKVVSVSAVGE